MLNYKVCSKCRVDRLTSDFGKSSKTLSGLRSECNICRRKSWRLNKEKYSMQRKEHYKNNSEVKKLKSSEYYYNNKEKVLEYRQNNREIINKKLKIHRSSKAKYTSYEHKLPITDKATLGNDDILMVTCKNCTNLFCPTNREVDARLQAVKGNYPGESNFYCSDKCKQTCKLYNFNPRSIDPESSSHISKEVKSHARACQTDHLKQLQIDVSGYNYCEKCGNEKSVIDLHHTLEVAKYGLEAISSAGHILLCKECHRELTSMCG